MKKKIILASGSPRRRELLTQIGIAYEVVPSDAEETVTETDPARVVESLSFRKAMDVAEKQAEDCVVIGADTVVALDQQILGKPADETQALHMLHALQGRSHCVYTGVTLLVKQQDRMEPHTFHERTTVHVATMNDREINHYIATGEPLDKAGAYGIQGAFAAYIRGIEGDYYNVVGLPLCHLTQVLKEIGFEI